MYAILKNDSTQQDQRKKDQRRHLRSEATLFHCSMMDELAELDADIHLAQHTQQELEDDKQGQKVISPRPNLNETNPEHYTPCSYSTNDCHFGSEHSEFVDTPLIPKRCKLDDHNFKDAAWNAKDLGGDSEACISAMPSTNNPKASTNDDFSFLNRPRRGQGAWRTCQFTWELIGPTAVFSFVNGHMQVHHVS